MVTGAASGIGRAIALALAREGAHLWLVDRNEAGLAACAREAGTLGVTARMSVCDLAEPAQIAALVEDARGGADGLNILVNGAGVGYFGYMHAMPHDEWNRLIAVNLLAPIQLSRELAADGRRPDAGCPARRQHRLVRQPEGDAPPSSACSASPWRCARNSLGAASASPRSALVSSRRRCWTLSKGRRAISPPGSPEMPTESRGPR